MKVYLPTVLFSLIGVSAIATPVQYIDCHNATTADINHVLLNFTSTQAGSFSIESPFDPASASNSTEELNLARVNFSSTTAATFTVTSNGVTFTYQMPAAALMQATPTFSATLTTEVSDLAQDVNQSLTCLAKMN